MQRELKFMQEAIRLSRQNMYTKNGGPFGCIVVKGEQIVGCGWNRVTSTNDPTAHAEVLAIREACAKLNTFQLNGCEIYTSCEPCPMCLGAIYWSRPEKVFYANTREDAAAIGFDDSFIYEELKMAMHERKIKMIGLGGEDALKVFKEWNTIVDKLLY
ncbi:MAG: nucleoside deaminase [Chitinophagaceae bacterium]